MARLAPVRKNSKLFLTGRGWRENYLPGPVSSRQKVQIPCQAEPKCANSLPWQGKCHSNLSPGRPGEKKIFFFGPRNSCRTPPHPAIPCQTWSRGKKRSGLVHSFKQECVSWSKFSSANLKMIQSLQAHIKHEGEVSYLIFLHLPVGVSRLSICH